MALFLYFLHYWFYWKCKIATLFFFHFPFNSVSTTLKRFLLKFSSHFRYPQLMAPLQFPTCLSLAHHSLLRFFCLWLPPYPCPKCCMFWQFLSHLLCVFSHLTSWILTIWRALFSDFPVGDSLCLMMFIGTCIPQLSLHF